MLELAFALGQHAAVGHAFVWLWCVLAQVVLPQLCFDDEDAELWEEDPQEFVRKVRAGGVLSGSGQPHTTHS